MSKRVTGKVILPDGITIWPHELRTAQALGHAGYVVEFLIPNKRDSSKSPDVIIEGLMWEIKSPKTDKLSAIERNLKRASKQSDNIIIDSQRMKKLHDSTIQRVLKEKLNSQKTIKRIIFINRKRQVIDISGLM